MLKQEIARLNQEVISLKKENKSLEMLNMQLLESTKSTQSVCKKFSQINQNLTYTNEGLKIERTNLTNMLNNNNNKKVKIIKTKMIRREKKSVKK